MRIAVLGTGVVGQTLAAKLRELGHEVALGSRTEGADKRTFADAAQFGELVINATNGANALEALAAAGAENLAGKVLIDVSNPLDFSRGMPPTLTVCNDDSIGEQIQRAYPTPVSSRRSTPLRRASWSIRRRSQGEHTMFVSGDDEPAKAQAVELLEGLGWPRAAIVDLGDIGGARAQEMYVVLWLRLYRAFETPVVNVHVVTE